MTSSGLGWTDLGDPAILGGLSHEFYHHVFRHYQKDAVWNRQTRSSYGNRGQGASAFDEEKQIASVFEPKVAKRIFGEFLKEEKVSVVTGRLDLKGGVVLEARMIRKLRLDDGRELAGKMFIDATYEGDLLPGAGVSFTVGREANERYGESYNGVQTKRALKNQLPDGIDPFVTPGDSSSGLLSGVEAGPSGPDGAGDKELQAFCYRMVLTDVAENRVAIGKPPGYREADYELLFRAIEAGQKTNFFKLDPMPTGRPTRTTPAAFPPISSAAITGRGGTGPRSITHSATNSRNSTNSGSAASSGLCKTTRRFPSRSVRATRHGDCPPTSSPTTATGSIRSVSARAAAWFPMS